MSVTAVNSSTAQASTAILNTTWNTSEVNKLRTLVNEQLPINTIAQRLGKSVSEIRQEAALAGLNLGAGPTGGSHAANAAKPTTGTNVDVKV